jgi:hypothetical protein
MLRGLCGGLLSAMLAAAASVAGAQPFRFEAEVSLDDMSALVRRQFSTRSTRDQVRAVFVGEGGATLVAHPRNTNVEKYLYDINLCSYYVWRWNISADYDRRGRLRQIYINGAPQLGGATRPGLPTTGPFYRLARPRPEAFKGEKSLAAVVADGDGDLRTTDDMMIMTGVAPSRADPVDMGRALNNPGEVWRSIFDFDEAKAIVPYAGDCAAADAQVEQRRAANPRP